MFEFLRGKLQLPKSKIIIAIALLVFLPTIATNPYLLENPLWLFGKPSDQTIIEALPSVRKVDYQALKSLLQAQRWEDADRETKRALAKTLSADNSHLLLRQENEIQKFPCTDLLTIDRLWVKFSNGQFGFSIQSQIVANDRALPNPEEIKQGCLKQCSPETVRTIEGARCKRGCETQHLETEFERIPDKMGRSRRSVLGSQRPAGYYPSPIETIVGYKVNTYRELAKRLSQCNIQSSFNR